MNVNEAYYGSGFGGGLPRKIARVWRGNVENSTTPACQRPDIHVTFSNGPLNKVCALKKDVCGASKYWKCIVVRRDSSSGYTCPIDQFCSNGHSVYNRKSGEGLPRPGRPGRGTQRRRPPERQKLNVLRSDKTIWELFGKLPGK